METKQKEDEMGDGTQATDLGCQNNMSAEKRHRNIEIEIELDPRAYKECACQKFAKFSAMPSEIERGQTEDDQCNENTVIMQLSSGLTRHQISDREPDATYHAAKG